jgi:hypothetical protein
MKMRKNLKRVLACGVLVSTIMSGVICAGKPSYAETYVVSDEVTEKDYYKPIEPDDDEVYRWQTCNDFLYTDKQGVVYKYDYDIFEETNVAVICGFRKNLKSKVKLPTEIKVKGKYYECVYGGELFDEYSAFTMATHLKSIDIGKVISSSKELPEVAFYGCTNLKTVKGIDKVEGIGMWSFYGAKKIKSLTFGKNLEYIGDWAFQGCKGLKTITIKSNKLSKKYMGRKIFKGTSQKITIKVPKKKVAKYKKIFKKQGNKNVVVKAI